MLEDFIYENHLGQRFYGKENGVFLNQSELRDYRWNYDTVNNRISRFYRSIMDRKIPLLVASKYEVEAVRVKNLLCELAEVDIVAGIPGKIIVGDYYTTGFITASTKSKYLINKRFCRIDLVLTSHDPAWYKEQTYTFRRGSINPVGFGVGIDYPYDYSHDYALTGYGRDIVCDAIKSSKFKMVFYGFVNNPTITINGHIYSLHGVAIGRGDTITIDSVNKTIVGTFDGEPRNLFDHRYRNSYVFEPIPPGEVSVRYDGTFDFDLTVVRERSEPEWT